MLITLAFLKSVVFFGNAAFYFFIFLDGTNQPNSFYSFKVNKVLILKYTQFIDENVKFLTFYNERASVSAYF